MGLLIKAALGALVVLLIGVLAKTKNYYIAGLIPLFPTFALIAHYIVASERGIEALRATIVFGRRAGEHTTELKARGRIKHAVF